MNLLIPLVGVLGLQWGPPAEPWPAEITWYDLNVVESAPGVKDLGITNWQATRIRVINESVPHHGVPPRDGAGMAKFNEMRRNYFQERWGRTLAILTPWQRQRLKQITMQMQGPHMVTRRELKDEFGLTQQQIARIEKVIRDFRSGRHQIVADDAAGVRAVRQQFRHLGLLVFKCLTPAQQEKWAQLVGKPYSLGPGEPVLPGTIVGN